MSSDVLEHAYKKIDAEILALQERIRSLRSSRNGLSLIHRLPPEVMSQIFMWLQSFYRGKLTEIPTHSNVKSLQKWLYVTHVSRHWRNIARSSRTLYSTIPTLNLGYARGMLEASGGAPLSIIDCMEHSLMLDHDLQDLIVSALPRARNLWLGPYSEQFLLPHLTTSNLDLERLHVWSWDNFSRTMFPNSLQHLQLHLCSLESYEWLSSLSNMVWLKLTHFYEDNSRSVGVETMLTILDGMPQLVSLELSRIFQPNSPEVNRVVPITAKLQRLKLVDDTSAVVNFLPWLTFAPRFSIAVRVIVLNASDSAAYWPPLFTQLGRHLRVSSMVIRLVHFGQPGYTGVICTEGGKESPCLRLNAMSKAEDLEASWMECVDKLPLGAIGALSTDTSWSAADWRDGPWHSIPSLHGLLLEKEQTSATFLNYLITSGTEGHGSEEHIPFASLQKLSLHGLNYGRELKSKVQKVLVERKKHGARLRNLTFYDCKISEDSIKQLSKVVDVVEQKKKAKKATRTA